MKKRPQPQIHVDLNIAIDVECEMCKHTCFTPTFIIKKIPALMSPTGKDTLFPIQVFKCDKCNHINKMFIEDLTN